MNSFICRLCDYYFVNIYRVGRTWGWSHMGVVLLLLHVGQTSTTFCSGARLIPVAQRMHLKRYRDAPERTYRGSRTGVNVQGCKGVEGTWGVKGVEGTWGAKEV